jgi:ABC-2 type transport system permease protein
VSDVALTWRQYRLERRLFWRNPSAAFFGFVFPLLLLGLLGAIFASSQSDLNRVVPFVAATSIMATTFSALAMSLTVLREQGVLKRMRGTPLPSAGYLAALGASAVTNALLQVAVVVVAGKLVFGVGWPADWLELVVFTLAGVACLAALGVAWSHVIPNVDAAPAFSNAVFLPVVAISGIVYGGDAGSGSALGDIARAFPLVHLADGLHGAMVTGTSLSDNAGDLAVIAVWLVVGVVLAVRGFSWGAKLG